CAARNGPAGDAAPLVHHRVIARRPQADAAIHGESPVAPAHGSPRRCAARDDERSTEVHEEPSEGPRGRMFERLQILRCAQDNDKDRPTSSRIASRPASCGDRAAAEVSSPYSGVSINRTQGMILHAAAVAPPTSARTPGP